MSARMSLGRYVAPALDLILAVLTMIWLMDGVPWEGSKILRHGADLRRLAVTLAVFAWCFFPLTRQKSLILQMVAMAWKMLTHSWQFRYGTLAAVTFFASSLGALQLMALRLPLFDTGTYHQILWALIRGKGFLSTVTKAQDYLLDHLSPTIALLAPAYWLSASSPMTLPVLHPFLLFGGVAAWVYLAERLPGVDAQHRAKIAAAVVVAGITFESLWGNLKWAFNMPSVGFCVVSWALALAYAHKGRAAPFILLIIAAATKETYLPAVAIISLGWAWTLLHESKKQNGFTRYALLFTILAIACIGAFVIFESIPHPADKNYFSRYYAYLGMTLTEVSRSLVLHPLEALRQIHEKIGIQNIFFYLIRIFLPWLGLPLFYVVSSWRSRHLPYGPPPIVLLLSILPAIVSQALSSYPALRESGFQYALELWPALAVLTVVALGTLKTRILPIAWALVMLFSLEQDPVGSWMEYASSTQETRNTRAFFNSIPKSASVTADTLTGTWLVGRERISLWPDFSALKGACPDWLVLTDAEALNESAKNCFGEDPVPVWTAPGWRAYQLSEAGFNETAAQNGPS